MTGFLGIAISDTTEKFLIVGVGVLIFAALAWFLRLSRLKEPAAPNSNIKAASANNNEGHHSYQSTLESTDGDVLDDYNMSRRNCHKKRISQTR